MIIQIYLVPGYERVIPVYLNHLYLKEKKNQKKKTIQLG
jgi:hypothetical protein